MKASDASELIGTIRKVVAGGDLVSPCFAEIMAAELRSGVPSRAHDLLSGREFEIFRLLASGRNNMDEIAHDLCLAKGTVYTYRSRVLEELKMGDDSELTRNTVENGLIPWLVRKIRFFALP